MSFATFAQNFFNNLSFATQRFTRYESEYDISSVCVLSTHFYPDLMKGDTKKWTEGRDINVLRKRLIIIPINNFLHWTVLVIINPILCVYNFHGDEDEEDVPCCCMLYCDPLGRPRQINDQRNKVYDWLNSLVDDSFNQKKFHTGNMPVYFPQLPQQENYYDCGMYMLAYIRGFLNQLYYTYTVEDARTNFLSKVTNSPEFVYDQQIIDEMRCSMDSLIDGLILMYQKQKNTKSTNSENKIETMTSSSITTQAPKRSRKQSSKASNLDSNDMIGPSKSDLVVHKRKSLVCVPRKLTVKRNASAQACKETKFTNPTSLKSETPSQKVAIRKSFPEKARKTSDQASMKTEFSDFAQSNMDLKMITPTHNRPIILSGQESYSQYLTDSSLSNNTTQDEILVAVPTSDPKVAKSLLLSRVIFCKNRTFIISGRIGPDVGIDQNQPRQSTE